MAKFYLTTPIYYVNARPHIGHAYSTIVADVIARRHRLMGDDTFFLTGTDEHGQKIERSALAAGVPPQEFADQVSATFEALWMRMGITNDDYIRTTEPRHKRGVQKLFRALQDRGQIYLDSYTGQYCVSDEAFVDVAPGGHCPDCGRLTETLTEENYFFKLSEYQGRLIDLIESDELAIQPEARKNEVLSFLRGDVGSAAPDALKASAKGVPYLPGALKDLSVSRSSFSWGIPVPGDEKHVVYVWLDALANYMTAVGYGSDDPLDLAKFEKYWPADLHLVGKEIIRFHCVYWPAFLMAAELPLPKSIVANGWLLFEESKMSKSRGNVVKAETILDAFGSLKPELSKAEQDLFGADVLRYFLLREIPFGQDGSFSFDALVTRYNSDLANGYGNLVSRTLSMIQQYFGGVVPAPILSRSQNAAGFSELYMPLIAEQYESISLAQVCLNLLKLVAFTDEALSKRAPWKLAKQDDEDSKAELQSILYFAYECIRVITALMHPILPFSTGKVWMQLGLSDIEEAAKNGDLKNITWGGLKPGTKLGTLAPVFPRADKGLIQVMADVEFQNAPKSLNDGPFGDGPQPGSAADAGPRTASMDEVNAGGLVAGSAAVTTERVGTPPHSEAHASGVFGGAVAAPLVSGPADASPQITIDDFAKVELRVAQIVVAERIPKADKLLRLEVDLGFEKRQILSGIAEWYTPEELIGRRIVVITNLAPRRMRGLESHGMLLAASSGDHGKPVLASFGEEIALGSRLK